MITCNIFLTNYIYILESNNLGHVTSIREAAADLTEQCALAEKEKKRAEARLEVLEEKELQRQK